MERVREDLGCACSCGRNIESTLAILRSQGRVGRGYVELHCGTIRKLRRKLGQKQSQNSIGHNSDQSHVQPRSKRAIGKSKRRAQGFDIFISIVKLY